jgi:transcriptional regulator with XRE-family HTH domain
MPGENDRRVGGVLRSIRERQGVTQLALAMKLGLPQSLVSKIETGTRALKLSEVFKYAEALGCDVNILMNEVGEAIRRD